MTTEYDSSGNGEAPARYIRLQVDLVMEITDTDELTRAAVEQIDGDEFMPDDERAHARDAVQRDEAEALAYLIDPFGLVNGVSGVELVQASWSSAHAEYDPESDEWDLYEEEMGEE
ncbi:hypothetical protein ACFOSC_02040 [Streptantibioticus rubrisoli]|uniref:Uncharacterized protein n=1 Tax=Streptantibioticus rubrisoli TaxID=1387313 RepID=A0ABT1PDB0_9ACTN|nr:hypothetical protein [Streptantibioticus rubrisoli]MCQ4043359.1 hypothetical protein [Streptantibioticus rubrisoli]